jgi:phosphoenolpyruvate carboxykinase (GTP)
MDALLSVNVEQWQAEMDSVGEYLRSYGERLPAALESERQVVVSALNEAS